MTKLSISKYALLALFACLSIEQATCDASPYTQQDAKAFVGTYCTACHGKEDPDGDLSLSTLSFKLEVKETTDHWEEILEQLVIKEMPPHKAKKKPSQGDRDRMIAWVKQSLKQAGVEVETERLLDHPAAGNLVDHKLLFDGSTTTPAYSPARVWRRSQHQYDGVMERLMIIPVMQWNGKGEERKNAGEFAALGYRSPFKAIGDKGTFTDYAKLVYADSSVLGSLLDAAEGVSARMLGDLQTWPKPGRPGRFLDARIYKEGFLKINAGPHRNMLTPVAVFTPFLDETVAISEENKQAVITEVYRVFLDRRPSAEEMTKYQGLFDRLLAKGQRKMALTGMITALLVSPDFVFRTEWGFTRPDQHGRRMLSPQELAYAVAYALTDHGPDAALMKAVDEGRLSTRSDVEREVRRILANDNIDKTRILRFFREFFGYTNAAKVFKDKFRNTNHDAAALVKDADNLVEGVLQEDRDVLARLLTTNKYYVAFTPEALRSEAGKKKHEAFIKNHVRHQLHYNGSLTKIHSTKSYNLPDDWLANGWTIDQPIALLKEQRAGMLTHPAWLVAHSKNLDNDIVSRGKWIQEKLLAGHIPDVPITVDAKLLEEPHETLRRRLRNTEQAYCMRCHVKMNPLGTPFEIYDDFGRFRTKEAVQVQGPADKRGKETIIVENRPLDASGELVGTGDPKLDGKVKNAIDLVNRLVKSERVRQSFLRHAFRYWMGRNETLNDSQSLIAIDKAYVDSNGSFNETIVSLLTSDSFLYRK